MIVVKIIGVLVTLPLAFFLPGYALFKSRLFTEFRMQWLAKLLFAIAVSAVAASLVALFLAEVGYLKIWLLDIVLAALTIGIRLAFGSTGRSFFVSRPKRSEVLAVAALCILAVGLFFRPFEFVIGDGDPGYYFNTGYNIAATGKVNIYDAAVPKMSNQQLETFFSNSIMQFYPYHLRDRATGRIQPLLYHQLPVWISVFISLFGTWGGFFVVPLLALLSILFIFAFVRRYTSLFGALAAAGLLALFFPQMYFARMPISEIASQFFILAALFFFLEFTRSKGPAMALAVAGAATVAMTLRAEAMIIAVPLLIVELVEVFRGKYEKGDVVFTNTMLLGLLFTWLYINSAEYQYFASNAQRVVRAFGGNVGMHRLMTVFLISIAGAALFFNLPFLRRLCARAGSAVGRAAARMRLNFGKAATGVLAAATLGLFLYLYFYAPATTGSAESPHNFFFNTALFFGGIAVFVFVAGLCWFIYESGSAGFSFVLFFSIFALSAAFSESGVTAGYLPWLSRRFMTLVIPALFIGFGYLAGRLWESRRTWLRPAVALTVALFLAFFMYAARPIVNFVQFQGVNAQVANLADKAGGNLLVFTNGFEGEAIGIPLRYQYGVDARRAYQLGPQVNFAKTVREYNAKGRKVLLETKALSLMGSGLLKTVSLEKEFTVRIAFPRLYSSYTVLPRLRGDEVHNITFYNVVPK